ncbi:MAG TPA: GTPase [Candidatus Limnocylindrales bacterium]|nr:GTPase [Candidatus Limnocylindrales bacterium]
MTEPAPRKLRGLVDRLEPLAVRRLATRPRSIAASERASQLRDHLRGHVRVRANSLDAPLLILILGPTGAGKSTLFNTLAGRAASPTGVLRPTTRQAVVLVHPDGRDALLEGSLAGLDRSQLRLVEDEAIGSGIALVDAPDLDSIEHANREMADHLIEAADLCLFVTTASRYADRVPWAVLSRVRERGLPLIVVVNRIPAGEVERGELLADVERLFVEAGLADAVAAGTSRAPGPTHAAPRVELVAVEEGDVEPPTEALRAAAIAPISHRIEELQRDRTARIELAARALSGSLAGLAPLLDRIADDCEHEAIDVDALHRVANHYYERELVSLREELGRASFLREEALRHWQRFVGADQITRFFSHGIGRLRGAISALVRPARAPVSEVRAATTEDLLAVAHLHAAEAARRTATAWADEPAIDAVISEDPTLWGASVSFDERLRERLDAWIDGIAADIQASGRPKRLLAQGASIGVNAVGTGVMLATFIHTGGLTGTEVGVAAATAFLNQKLLSALFGEAAMVELIGGARRRLDELLAASFAEELARFHRLAPDSGQLTDLAVELRADAAELRDLPAGLPRELRVELGAVMATRDGSSAPRAE